MLATLKTEATRFVRRTPARTFVIYPIVVLAAKLIGTGGKPRLAWQFAPMLFWGYLQYRLCGNYRLERGRGGPGLEVPPEDLVTAGPYSIVRNPMYLGHIIFLTGLALIVRSKLAVAIAAATAFWFNERVAADEKRLVRQFGEPYREYLSRVPRWLPGMQFLNRREVTPSDW
jgi:hypothetical protein